MMIKRFVALTVIGCLIFSFLPTFASAQTPDPAESISDHSMAEYENTYSDYALQHAAEKKGAGEVSFNLFGDDVLLSGSAEYGTYGEKNALCLPVPKDSFCLPLHASADGLYAIRIRYTGYADTDKTIKIGLQIDGECPFFEADFMELPRCYVNETNDFERDSFGNEMRPVQRQIINWQNIPLYQNDVGTAAPYLFYLTQGEHTLSLTAHNGGVCIADLEFYHPSETPSYEEYLKRFEGRPDGKAAPVLLQGEKADRKSDISLYPLTDRTSCATQPFSEKNTKLNTIGGSNWANPGQWIEWDFHIESAGFYQISLRVRQNENQGMKCYRTISLNHEILFSELENYGFDYKRSWYVETLSDPETGRAFEFYLEPGEYTLRMEATTGEMCGPLAEVNGMLTELNDLYHNIIMITGTSPDTYRDYNLEKAIPNLKETMNGLADKLESQMQEIRSITGGSGTQAVSLITLADQLRELARRPKTISDRVSNFYSNISAVSAWANSAFQQPLEIDCLQIGAAGEKKLKEKAGFFSSLISSTKVFLFSFIIDYDTIGESVSDPDLVVWTVAGRDQAESLKALIDRDFVKSSKVNVALKQVQNGLVEAVVAGTGPDIALSVAMNQPVDFASRGILQALDEFDGFDRLVDENYAQSALIPFTYDGHVYALPETQEFNMMFYRTDILEQLGLSVPDTWEDLTGIMAVLARNNMQVGVPSLTSTSAGIVNTSFPKMLVTMFLQNDVGIYKEDLRSTNLDSAEAVKAFEQLTNLYTKYGLPVYFDATNRFRTGEMPIIVAPMSTYNALAISAPEIAGRWGMALIPGTARPDGTINRTDEFTSTGCVLFKSAKNKEAAWKFLAWWVSEQTQYDYGMELEAVLGASGRYITANRLAFERLPWDSETLQVIREQWNEVSTVPQVPGYYFVSRYLTNAISDTIVNNENARVVLNRYRDTIDAELKRKNEQLDALWKKK